MYQEVNLLVRAPGSLFTGVGLYYYVDHVRHYICWSWISKN